MTTDTHGHANAIERARITELQDKLDARSITTNEMLDLALLALEPLHDAFRAAELLQGILSKDPKHELAKLWLAYAYVYDFMDEGALRDAVKLGDQLVEQSTAAEIRAGALLLKATALRDLGEPDPAIELLASIELAPDWISTRQLLAKIYEERGDREAAEFQLRKAMEAVSDQPDPKDYAEYLFEMLITARGADRIADWLQDQLRELAG